MKHGTERHAKGFKSWTQFVAMLFCHLAREDSLREICHGLSCCNGKLGVHGKRKFRFKNKLLTFDSKTISLCLSLFPWASFRRAKGRVKEHVLLDHGEYMPSFVHITEAQLHDSKVALILSLPQGSIVAIDRGYVDFDMLHLWTERKVFFVPRMKKNLSYINTKRHDVPKTGTF